MLMNGLFSEFSTQWLHNSPSSPLSLPVAQDWWHFGRSSHLPFGGCENKATVIVEELRLLSPAVRIEKATKECGRPDLSFA